MIFLVALVLLAVAWLFNLGLLVCAAWILLVLFFLSHLFSSGWISALSGERKMGQQVAAPGDSVPVTVKLTNTGKLPVSWVLVNDMLHGAAPGIRGQGLQVSGRHIEVTDFRGGRHQLFYQLKCKRRGYYQIGPLIAETGDLFGLNRRYRVLQEPDYLLVTPRVIELEGYDLSSRRPIGEIVMTHRLFEDPTRIAGIRAYQNGDSLSRIHWRATARTGQLQSKVYEPSSVAGATLLLDFHEASFERRDEPLRSELAVSCAASIANAVHQMGQQVGLASNGRDAADRIRVEGWQGDRRTRKEARQSASMLAESDRLQPVIVPTRRNDHQFIDVQQALARLEQTDGLAFSDFVVQVQQRLPRDATIIAILSRVDLAVGVALGQLRRLGFAVTAVINSADEERFCRLSAPLVAEGIETRHLRDEDSIRSICQQQVWMTFQ
jgi:uncharacterized protein (DUF58 family)